MGSSQYTWTVVFHRKRWLCLRWSMVMQMMVWQAARRPVLVSRHFNGEEWDRKNSAMLSAAWHRRCGFIESETRRPSLWDLTVAAGWQMALWELWGKRREWDKGYTNKSLPNMWKHTKYRDINCQFMMKYSAATSRKCHPQAVDLFVSTQAAAWGCVWKAALIWKNLLVAGWKASWQTGFKKSITGLNGDQAGLHAEPWLENHQHGSQQGFSTLKIYNPSTHSGSAMKGFLHSECWTHWRSGSWKTSSRSALCVVSQKKHDPHFSDSPWRLGNTRKQPTSKQPRNLSKQLSCCEE